MNELNLTSLAVHPRALFDRTGKEAIFCSAEFGEAVLSPLRHISKSCYVLGSVAIGGRKVGI